MDEEWDWFEEVDDAEPTDPILSAVLAAVRRSADRWSSLGITPDHTIARLDDSRLRLFVDVSDTVQPRTLATLRVDVVPDGRSAMAWTSASLAETESRIEDAEPHDLARFSSVDMDGPQVASRVIGWLERQLARVIRRYEWLKGGEMRARCYVLEDANLVLVEAGDVGLVNDLSSADQVVQVRP